MFCLYALCACFFRRLQCNMCEIVLPPHEFIFVCLLLSCQIWFTTRLWLRAFAFFMFPFEYAGETATRKLSVYREKEHSHHIETWSKAVSLMKLECFFSQRCPFYVAFYCFLFCHLLSSVQHTSLMERARKKSISFFRCDCNLRTFWIVRLPCNLALLNWLWTSTSIDAVAAREKSSGNWNRNRNRNRF